MHFGALFLLFMRHAYYIACKYHSRTVAKLISAFGRAQQSLTVTSKQSCDRHHKSLIFITSNKQCNSALSRSYKCIFTLMYPRRQRHGKVVFITSTRMHDILKICRVFMNHMSDGFNVASRCCCNGFVRDSCTYPHVYFLYMYRHPYRYCRRKDLRKNRSKKVKTTSLRFMKPPRMMMNERCARFNEQFTKIKCTQSLGAIVRVHWLLVCIHSLHSTRRFAYHISLTCH